MIEENNEMPPQDAADKEASGGRRPSACCASLVAFRKIRRNGKCRMQGSGNTIYRNTGGFGSVYHGGVRHSVQVGMDTMVEPLSDADLTIPHNVKAQATQPAPQMPESKNELERG
jgi:hypothetical protein